MPNIVILLGLLVLFSSDDHSFLSKTDFFLDLSATRYKRLSYCFQDFTLPGVHTFAMVLTWAEDTSIPLDFGFV